MLFVSFASPHFPLTAPPQWFYRYWQQDLPMPKQYAQGARPHHPFLDTYAHTVDYDEHFASEADVKRAIAGYAGLVSAIDKNVGHVLRALRDTGLVQDTRVIYTSDHGDNVGARGLWGKSTLYEESAGVPPDRGGPRRFGWPRRRRAGIAHRLRPDDPRSGRSAAARRRPRAARRVVVCACERRDLAAASHFPDHAIGSLAGAFMSALRRWKYCHYVGAPLAALRPRC